MVARRGVGRRSSSAIRARCARCRRTCDACGVDEACAIIRGDFQTVAHRAGAFDLVLLDPPYAVDDLAGGREPRRRLAAPGGQLVLEHSRVGAHRLSTRGSLMRYRVLMAGDSALSFYAPPA